MHFISYRLFISSISCIWKTFQLNLILYKYLYMFVLSINSKETHKKHNQCYFIWYQSQHCHQNYIKYLLKKKQNTSFIVIVCFSFLHFSRCQHLTPRKEYGHNLNASNIIHYLCCQNKLYYLIFNLIYKIMLIKVCIMVYNWTF